MNITEVRVRKVNGGGKLKAFASITIDGLFVVHDLKVIEGHKGFFVAMPSRRTSNGEFKDIAHPIATEAREMIQRRIIEAYWKLDGATPVGDRSDEGNRLRDERDEAGDRRDRPFLGEGTPLADVEGEEAFPSDDLSGDL